MSALARTLERETHALAANDNCFKNRRWTRTKYTYDSNGQVTEITFYGTVVYNVAWMPFGPAKSWTEYSGAAYTRTYDQDYRITGITQGSVNTLGLTWDNASRLTGLTETSLSNKSYGYDSLDRLTGITIGTASPTSYAYDNNGNRTSLTDPSSNVTTYNYTSGTNILSSLSGHVTQSFTYDSSANMTADGTNTWTYDQRGRMASNTVSGTTVNYDINDIGLRVRKRAASNTEYAYDEAGHELGEYTSTGTPIRETLYLGDIPVALLGTSGATTTTYNIAPDWINAPHIVIDGYNHLIWSWDHLAWGDNAPNQNPGGIGTFVYNWRFPGQAYDSESGLFYNLARDYSSTLSRYVESDPMGLGSGDYSTYGYAGANPLKNVDPSGRDFWVEGSLPGEGGFGFHQKICVGHPDGHNRVCISFAPTTGLGQSQTQCVFECEGQVYPNTPPSGVEGKLTNMYEYTSSITDRSIEQDFNALLWATGPYSILASCRDFSQNMFTYLQTHYGGSSVPLFNPAKP